MVTIPLGSPHPVAWQNPVIMRVSAALAAAGAWDAVPIEQNVAGGSSTLLSFTYTRGGVGGAFDYQLQLSPYSIAGNVPAGADEWVEEALYAAGPVVAGADSQSLVQVEYETFTSQGAAAESFAFGPVELGGVERLRIRARESGAVGTPGTLQVTMEVHP